ncbi:MAG: transposase, partial [Eubacterium sp.]
QQLNADSYERALGRTDYRSGTRERHLVTRIGRLTLHVPRHRNKPFYILLFPSSITPQQPSVHPPACRCSAALCCRSSRQFFQ